jgi:putative membrane protein
LSVVTFDRLSGLLFVAPSWRRSLAIIVILGIIIDGASLRTGRGIAFFGTFGYIIPALFAFLATKPLVEVFGKHITWNRSALLAMTCTVFCVITSLSPILLFIHGIFSLLYAISLGLVFAIRLFVLVAIADYRLSRMVVPGITQSAAGAVAGWVFFGVEFLQFAVIIHILFGSAIVLFVWLVERPLKSSFHVSALNFVNAFIAHLTDGSKALEDFFLEIGESVYVPQVSLFFRREGRPDVIFTVPNIHPGPMGEIGGANLPFILHNALGNETLVAHGCASHDFNLVSEAEVSKIIDAVQESQNDLVYHSGATQSSRFSRGSVNVLAQGFGDSILLVSTRSPLKTEDLDFSIGLAILTDNRRHYEHVAFVDAHNSMVNVTDPVMPATLTAYEYMRACEDAAFACISAQESGFSVGVSHKRLPFTREQGFGDLGIQALVIETGDQRTAYVLFDGNNMVSGMREQIRTQLLTFVDDCEIMTTDTHSVNTLNSKNPIGYRTPLDEFLPHAEEVVREAIADCSPAEVAGSTAWCKGVVVFGSHRVSQLASTVNAMLLYITPLALGILGFAFMLSFIAYLVLT